MRARNDCQKDMAVSSLPLRRLPRHCHEKHGDLRRKAPTATLLPPTSPYCLPYAGYRGWQLAVTDRAARPHPPCECAVKFSTAARSLGLAIIRNFAPELDSTQTDLACDSICRAFLARLREGRAETLDGPRVSAESGTVDRLKHFELSSTEVARSTVPSEIECRVGRTDRGGSPRVLVNPGHECSTARRGDDHPPKLTGVRGIVRRDREVVVLAPHFAAKHPRYGLHMDSEPPSDDITRRAGEIDEGRYGASGRRRCRAAIARDRSGRHCEQNDAYVSRTVAERSNDTDDICCPHVRGYRPKGRASLDSQHLASWLACPSSVPAGVVSRSAEACSGHSGRDTRPHRTGRSENNRHSRGWTSPRGNGQCCRTEDTVDWALKATDPITTESARVARALFTPESRHSESGSTATGADGR
jgi:hypothetical protein